MAEVVLRHLAADRVLDDGSVLGDHLLVSSAGTGGWHAGEPMDPRASAALEQRGYTDHGHRPAPSRPPGCPGSTSWSAWTGTTARPWRASPAPGARDDRYEDRLVLLRSFERGSGGEVDVPDPYYGDDDGFERCLDLVEAGCRGLVDHLSAGGAGPTP